MNFIIQIFFKKLIFKLKNQKLFISTKLIFYITDKNYCINTHIGEVIYMEENENPSIKKAIDDLLDTSIIKEISKRNDKDFVQKLAIWLVRYILLISSMNESLKIDLEEVLINLHGEKFRKILEITEKTFQKIKAEEEKYNKYIW